MEFLLQLNHIFHTKIKNIEQTMEKQTWVDKY